jgi:hypothetical protein
MLIRKIRSLAFSFAPMFVAGVLLSSLAAATAAGAVNPAATPIVTAGPQLRVELQPRVVRLRERATIAVAGIRARSLEVLLAGATDSFGRQLPWRSLRPVGGGWVGTLPAPALRGIYPVVLRRGAGTPVFGSRGLRLRVFAPGTGARPSFDTPIEVARWWVRAVPHATLVAVKAWPRPAFDRRDRRLHRLFVVAYSPLGQPQVRDRLGMFVTAFRDGYRAPWRLLEASVLP